MSFLPRGLQGLHKGSQKRQLHLYAALFSSTAAFVWALQRRRTRLDVNCKEGHDDGNDEKLWQGQVLKRQVHRPKVPYPLWDYNWDGLMTEETTLKAQSKSDEESLTGTTRHIILVRHGQYDETHQDDSSRKLTKLGRVQAELTGQRLAVMQKGISDKFGACSILRVHSSSMTRARETAEIIAKHLDGVELAKADPSLNEALPAPVVPVRPDIDATKEVDENHDRIEDAFQKYVHRKTGASEKPQHEFEIIVCHGNIIRYFFCRALQIPPEAWLRMSTFNCSITYLMVKPNGYVSCRMMGDIGHLGYEHSSFSMHHGFVWS